MVIYFRVPLQWFIIFSLNSIYFLFRLALHTSLSSLPIYLTVVARYSIQHEEQEAQLTGQTYLLRHVMSRDRVRVEVKDRYRESHYKFDFTESEKLKELSFANPHIITDVALGHSAEGRYEVQNLKRSGARKHRIVHVYVRMYM